MPPAFDAAEPLYGFAPQEARRSLASTMRSEMIGAVPNGQDGRVAIPTTLAGWTYDVIVGLLEAHVYEDIRFDWKAGVPRSADPLKDALIKNAVGMANGTGGFLVFGVADDRGKTARSRVVGVPAEQEVQKQVGELLRLADPNVPFWVGQPPVAIPRKRGRVGAVVEVLTGSAPHAFKGTFYKRTLRGSDTMSTAEVRDLFIRKEERLARIRLLLLEVTSVRETLTLANMSTSVPAAVRIRRIDTRMLAELQAELHPVLAAHPDLVAKLTRLRSFAEAFNSQVEMALQHMAARAAQQPYQKKDQDFAVHWVLEGVRRIAGENTPGFVDDVLNGLSRAFNEPRPPVRTETDFLRDGW